MAICLDFGSRGGDGPPDVAAELRLTQAKLARLERAFEEKLAAVREEVRSGRTMPDGRGATRPGRAPAVPGESEDPPPAPHYSREAGEKLAPAQPDALRALASWKEDVELRSRWLFATEASAIEAFGGPDEIATRGTTEWWSYWDVQGDRILGEVRLKLNNGRLIEALELKWEPPRKLPRSGS